MTTNSRAIINLHIELSICDNWAPTSTVEQIHKQAKESALEKLRNTMGLKIIGTPEVTIVMVDQK
jgi:hypothetical protein